MLSFDVADLDLVFGQSNSAIGVVDPVTLEVMHANHHFSLLVEELHAALGLNPITHWVLTRTALEQCLSSGKLVAMEDADKGIRIEFVPVFINSAEKKNHKVVLCNFFRKSNNSDNLYQEILENLPQHAWACSVSGELFWRNKTSIQYSHGDVIDHDLTNSAYIQRVHPDDIRMLGINVSMGIIEGHIEPFRGRLKNQQGEYQWFLFTAKPVMNEKGEIKFWAGSSLSIDQFYKKEKELEIENDRLLRENVALNRQLQETQGLVSKFQKMDLVNNLAGGVAHDLNNMLFVMSMNLQPIQQRIANSGDLERMDAIRACIRNATRLAAQLSSFSGRKPQNTSILNLPNVLQETQTLFEQAIGAESSFSMVVAEDVKAVLADRTYLENAIINLLINSRDAVNGRGHIALTVDKQRVPTEQGVQSFVVIAVKDDGVGMSEELLGKVFEPFFTTKDPDKGTGLGLAMVKNFVENSNGFVKVNSVEGEGTEIRMYLPEAEAVAQEPVQSSRQQMIGKGTIMLIEDNLGVRTGVSTAMRDMGYALVTASNLEQAMLLMEASVRPDLIVSDIRVPGKKTVLDLIEYVEANGKVPMIFITGYSAEVVIHEGLIGGRYPVLFKPFELDDLAKKINELLAASGYQAKSAD